VGIMSNIFWRLADVASGMLDCGERDTVRGDLTESGATGGQALRDVLGLVLRRQAAVWKQWRPWLALVVLAVPLGMLLGLVSRSMADGSAIYAWLYLNNWTSSYLVNAGARLDLLRHSSRILLEFLMLFCFSWTSGFMLGILARRTIAASGALFCLLLVFGKLLGAPPRFLGHALSFTARDLNAAVFELTFYRVMFPLIVQSVLVLVPSLWGMRQGALPCKGE
jgi:hypothetical protein